MTSCDDNMVGMIRTQIQLTEEQARRLRRLASDEAIPLAEMIRRCVDRTLAEIAPDRSALYARAATIIGAFRDPEGADDLAEEHDRHLENAYE